MTEYILRYKNREWKRMKGGFTGDKHHEVFDTIKKLGAVLTYTIGQANDGGETRTLYFKNEEDMVYFKLRHE